MTSEIIAFYRAASMQGGLSQSDMSVCPSVRLTICSSVCQTRELWKKTKETYAKIFIPYKRPL